jgi:hypothetical protein
MRDEKGRENGKEKKKKACAHAPGQRRSGLFIFSSSSLNRLLPL